MEVDEEHQQTRIISIGDGLVELALCGKVREVVLIYTTDSGLHTKHCCWGIPSAVGMLELGKLSIMKAAADGA
jgi:hypothetical protein